jgi:hypothetical protein
VKNIAELSYKKIFKARIKKIKIEIKKFLEGDLIKKKGAKIIQYGKIS